jgi:hypothetical protein
MATSKRRFHDPAELAAVFQDRRIFYSGDEPVGIV